MISSLLIVLGGLCASAGIGFLMVNPSQGGWHEPALWVVTAPLIGVGLALIVFGAWIIRNGREI